MDTNRNLIPEMVCNLLSVTVLLLAPFILTGCGSNLASVTGTVTFDDRPLESGRIVFQATGESMAYGELGPDGRYTLIAGDQQGITPGEYIVTVATHEVGEITGRGNPPLTILITPARYGNKDTSDLRADVLPGHNKLDFELTSK